MRRLTWVLLTTLVAATASAAITAGTTLYVRARNTRLVSKPGGAVIGTLQPGDPVIWKGTVAGSPGWHAVEVKGKKGALLTANLATKPPAMEIVATQGTTQVDQATFLSSAAATKALAPAAEEYGNTKPDMQRAVVQLKAMENLSDAVKLEAIAEHVQRSGLVGASSAPVAAVGGAR